MVGAAATLSAGRSASAGPSIACEAGAVLRVDLLEDGGTRQWCMGEGGLGQGPVEERGPDGGLRLAGRLRAGAPTGQWRRPVAGGLSAVGPMAPDGPIGAWQLRAPGVEEPLAQVTHGRALEAPPALPAGPAPLRFRWTGASPVAALPAGEASWLLGEQRALRVRLADGAVLDAVGLAQPLGPGAVATPSGALLALSRGGEVFAVRGGLPLRLHTPKGSTHAIFVDDSLQDVILRDGAGFIERRSLDTGASAWRSRLSMAALAPLLLPEQGLVVVARERSLLALELETGAVRWSARLEGPPVAMVADGDGGVVALSAGGGLSALAGADGAARWRGSAPVGGPPHLQLGPDALWVWGEETLHGVNFSDGSPLMAPLAAPRGLRWVGLEAGLAGARLCAAAPGGGLRCGPLEAFADGGALAWRAPSGALLPEGAPLSADTVWMRAGADLLAVDPVELALMQGLPELSVSEGEAEPVELAWWARLVSEGLERVDEGVVELGEHRVLEAGDEDCPALAGALWTGAPPPLEAEDDLLDATPAVVPRLELRPPVGAGPLEPAAPWMATLLGQETAVHLWVPWWPVIESVVPAERDDRLRAAVDAALRCAGPPVRLRGEVVLFDGQRRRLFAGRLELRPEPREVGGLAGCGIWVRYNDEPLGLWSAPEAPTWAPGRFVWGDTAPSELDWSPELPLPLGRIEGEAHVLLLQPWGEDVGRTEVGGWVASLEAPAAPLGDPADGEQAAAAASDGPLDGPHWVLRAGGAGVALRWPVGGLALDLDPGEPADAALSHREWWRMEAMAPLGPPDAATPAALRAWPLWRRAGCAAELSPGEASAARP